MTYQAPLTRAGRDADLRERHYRDPAHRVCLCSECARRPQGSEAPLVTALRTIVTLISAARPSEGGRFWMLKWREADRVLTLAEKALSGSAPQPPTSPTVEAMAKALHEAKVDCNPLLPMDGRIHPDDPKRHMRLHHQSATALCAALAASQEPSTGDDR